MVILAAIVGILIFACLVSEDKQIQDHVKPDNRNNGGWILAAAVLVIAVILFF